MELPSGNLENYQVMYPTILWVHNFHIWTSIEKLQRKSFSSRKNIFKLYFIFHSKVIWTFFLSFNGYDSYYKFWLLFVLLATTLNSIPNENLISISTFMFQVLFNGILWTCIITFFLKNLSCLCNYNFQVVFPRKCLGLTFCTIPLVIMSLSLGTCSHLTFYLVP
jgi:hypothetical protein